MNGLCGRNLGFLIFKATDACIIYIEVFNLKVDRILIQVIYLLRFATCYITQLTCIYSKSFLNNFPK
jgi:hypothetical protein